MLRKTFCSQALTYVVSMDEKISKYKLTEKEWSDLKLLDEILKVTKIT